MASISSENPTTTAKGKDCDGGGFKAHRRISCITELLYTQPSPCEGEVTYYSSNPLAGEIVFNLEKPLK